MCLFDQWHWAWCEPACSQLHSLERPRVSVAHQLAQKKTLGSRKPWNGSSVDPLLTRIAAHAGYFSCDEAAQIQRRRDSAPCVDSLPGAAVCCRARRGGGPTVYSFSTVSISIFSEEVRKYQGSSYLMMCYCYYWQSSHWNACLLWVNFCLHKTKKTSIKNKGILVWKNRRLRPSTCTTLHSRHHIFCLTVTRKRQQNTNISATGVFKVWTWPAG